MVALPDRVKVNTPTAGQGAVTFGEPVSPYRVPPASFSGELVPYAIEDSGDGGATAWETGQGTLMLTEGVWTLSRGLRESSTGGLLELSGAAVVMISPGGVDLDAFKVPISQTASFSAAVSQLYELHASALTITLPASPGAGGGSIKVVGLNGDEAANPHTIAVTGSDTLVVAGASDTSALLNMTGTALALIARTGGWDVVLGG